MPIIPTAVILPENGSGGLRDEMNLLLAELRRRKVFRTAGVYAVGGWLLAQVAGTLEEALNLPPAFDTIVVSMLLAGFPLVLLASWLFTWTGNGLRFAASAPVDGLTRRAARRLDVLVVGSLSLLTALIGWQLVTFTFSPAAGEGPLAGAETEAGADAGAPGSRDVVDPRPSIAVMAFEDFTAEADQEYFAKGISEELLNVLARIDGLRVPSRTSSFAFQGTATPISQIGEALNVAHVLEGSVRKAGQTLRITAQLIDTRTDAHLWSQTYDRPLTAENLFAVQDEIAAAVVTALSDQLKFVIAEEVHTRTESVEAYQLYLRAREAMNQRTPASLEAAARLYDQVVRLDPNFAPAYSGLADTFLLMRSYGDMSRAQAVSSATPLVDRALALAPGSAEALTSAAFIAIERSAIDEAIAYAGRAIDANPNYGASYLRLGSAYEFVGRTAAALDAYEQAALLDPLSPVVLSAISYSKSKLGDLDGALEAARYNLRWNPDNFLALDGMASVRYEMNDFGEAHYFARRVQALNPQAPPYRLFDIYLQTGLYDLAREIAPADEDRALVATAEGRPAAALALLTPPDTGIHANILFLLREFAAAGQTTTVQEFMASVVAQESPLSPAQISPTQLVTAVARALELPQAPVLMRKLSAYFEGASPRRHTLPADLYTGAAWQMLNGTDDDAYAWLERFVDLGYTRWDLRLDPVFDPIRNTRRFAAIQARADEIAARHRQNITTQLSAPEGEET